MCRVKGLEDYVQVMKSEGVDLSVGYLFRPMSNSGIILEEPLKYNAIHDCLKYYLATLGLDEGETPHSLRAGCALTMVLSGAATSSSEVMRHVGWFTDESVQYYTRAGLLKDSESVSSRLAKAVVNNDEPENIFRQHTTSLPAFQQ
ncbi:unnamed protein product [Owenia fusiformis]|uniref:Uncharacterized protein n=1 Tax=Owenia fusiformis TaxID=6347 RepID=A0A8S4NPF4_OWEFU|nr:unnamed protein product [Owenia fusiformis]